MEKEENIELTKYYCSFEEEVVEAKTDDLLKKLKRILWKFLNMLATE